MQAADWLIVPHSRAPAHVERDRIKVGLPHVERARTKVGLTARE